MISRRSSFSVSFEKRRTAIIASILFVGSIALFLVPKVILLSDHDYTKLTTDSWAHFSVIERWENAGALQTDVYSYYSRLPLTYAPQVILHEITGMSLFDSMTMYYLVAGIAGLFIIHAIGREVVWGTNGDKIIFSSIAGIIYAFLQYTNLLFVQQYPIALGTVAALFCIYSFILLVKRRRYSLVYLCAASAILVISHPFGPVLTALLFLAYFGVNKVRIFLPNPYPVTISRRTALFMCSLVIVAGMIYAIFVAAGAFDSGVRWSELNAKYTWKTITSRLFEETVSGVEQSFEGRYSQFETMLYAMSWALPAASALGTLIFYSTSRKARKEDDAAGLILPLAIVSTLLFFLTFSFSFVEFAFSRYFGAFALTFSIPVISFVVFRISKYAKMKVLRYSAMALVCVGVIASVTDPSTLPNISFGGNVYRNTDVYPTKSEFAAWDEFYATVGEDQKLIRTNLNAAPTEYLKDKHEYENIIVQNPKNYSLTSDNAYLIIDKEKLDLSEELRMNRYADKVYDNSQVYVVR